MTSQLVFPLHQLPGIGWPWTKTPMWRTRTQRTVSGREMRLQDQTVPLWKWSIPVEFMRDGADRRGGHGLGTGHHELDTLMGFFNQVGGSFLPFLLEDPTDRIAIGQKIGVGDGTSTQAQLVKTRGVLLAGGGSAEPIWAPNVVTAIYVNGSRLDGSLYSVNLANGLVTFTSAPVPGGIITADFSYYFRVRFADDSNDFDYLFYQVWGAKKIEFQSVLP